MGRDDPLAVEVLVDLVSMVIARAEASGAHVAVGHLRAALDAATRRTTH